MAEKQNNEDIIDTTDSLEAVNVFKSMKNFFFFAALICLILLQIIFWVNNLGLVDKSSCPNTLAAQKPLSLEVPLEESTAPVEPAEKLQSVDDAAAQKLQEDLTKTAAEITGEPAPVEETLDVASEDKGPSIPKIKCCYLSVLIKICNFILIITTGLYCLTLLMAVKISLCGRLGGLSHISRAFFTSLLALAIIIPWQVLLKGVLIGAVYTPTELLWSAANPNVPAVISEILYYFRFPGLWLIAVILLISAQSKSIKWARTILRRLGLLH